MMAQTEQTLDDLVKVAATAAAMLDAIYQHVDRVNAAGGATSISGVAACNTMLKSLNGNRARVEKLVMEPIRAAIAKARGAS
jgi:hypothetical protein